VKMTAEERDSGAIETSRGIVEGPEPAGDAASARFVIDTKRSRFTVQAFATGMLSMMGHNPTIAIRRFNGELNFFPDAPEKSGLQLAIEPASFSVEDDISEKDRREMERLMKSELLEVERYPEIRYESTGISVTKLDSAMYTAAVNGKLSFHGVTRLQSLRARITVLGEILRASGGLVMKQSDYQLKPVSVAGGALKLKDELKFSFEIVANRQDPEA
jgi:polyisoprenoid-binding protein YceI